MRVLLAGEGKTELGEWAKEAPYRDEPGETGVLLALLRRVGWANAEPVDGLLWSKIRKYRAGDHASPEERNVLGLALNARRARCSLVVFSRDRDGDPQRQLALEAGILRARELFPELLLVGGIAIEMIEAWILVLCGHPGEDLPAHRTTQELEERLGITSLQQKVDAVAEAQLDRVPHGSLSTWLERARGALAAVAGRLADA